MRALLVGLETKLQRGLALALPARGCGVEVAQTATEALAFLATARHYQLIVIGEAAPAVGRLRTAAPDAALVWARSGVSLREAVDAVRSGAVDVWDELPAPDRLKLVLLRESAGPALTVPADLVAQSQGMRDLLSLLGRAAPTDAPVLLTGETGTGKGKLARWLHEHSGRGQGPFVVVDCAGLAATLAENELFGHARGAFTGAERESVGRFEAADGGTVFLDEIGELPLGTQQKLLRFLEERQVERLGEVRAREVDARVIAATHRDLRRLVRDGRFREDLLYRLEVVEARVPPLRERLDDLGPLIQIFAAGAGVPGLLFDEAARRRLMAYAWPGNVRELRNVVERALVLRPGGTVELGVELLPPRLSEPEELEPVGDEPLDLEALERSRIVEALRRYPKLDEAAAALGIDPSTLWRKRRRLGLS